MLTFALVLMLKLLINVKKKLAETYWLHLTKYFLELKSIKACSEVVTKVKTNKSSYLF